VPLAHASNPRYFGGKDQEDLEKNLSLKGLVEWVQTPIQKKKIYQLIHRICAFFCVYNSEIK
jgi:hypothetical protein